MRFGGVRAPCAAAARAFGCGGGGRGILAAGAGWGRRRVQVRIAVHSFAVLPPPIARFLRIGAFASDGGTLLPTLSYIVIWPALGRPADGVQLAQRRSCAQAPAARGRRALSTCEDCV
jgi:hypothetical protein